jgi:Ca-activated chloride channel family protein
MSDISNLTGGKYFRATNKESLINIYQEIDKMEKTIVSEKNFTNKAEHFLPFAITAALILLLEFILRLTLFKSIP